MDTDKGGQMARYQVINGEGGVALRIKASRGISLLLPAGPHVTLTYQVSESCATLDVSHISASYRDNIYIRRLVGSRQPRKAALQFEVTVCWESLTPMHCKCIQLS